MALSVGYMARETATNLRRNLLMTVAATITMAVALIFLGSALLWQKGVDKQTSQWRGGVELSIFMRATATPQQIDAVRSELEASPEVKRATYVDQAEAFREMKTLFANQPQILESFGEQDAPPSFRVVPRRAEQVADVGERFKDKPGVDTVTYAKETIDVLLKSTRTKRNLANIVAGAALVAGLLVILNTVRMAIFSRRREVAIMKLVGATNWFIRIPFMLEGVVQGLIGATAAFIVVFVFRNTVMSFVNDAAINQFAQLYATPGEAITVGIWMLIIGAGFGGLGSAISVRRFLDV